MTCQCGRRNVAREDETRTGSTGRRRCVITIAYISGYGYTHGHLSPHACVWLSSRAYTNQMANSNHDIVVEVLEDLGSIRHEEKRS